MMLSQGISQQSKPIPGATYFGSPDSVKPLSQGGDNKKYELEDGKRKIEIAVEELMYSQGNCEMNNS